LKDLNKKAFGGLLNLLICVGLLIFLPAWTLHYWQGWLFLFAFFAPSIAITVFLMMHDPKLLERRVHAGVVAEKQTSQKTLQGFAAAAFVATIALPALDHRFGWSAVPAWATLAGDAMVVLGFLAVFLVFKENSFTSGIVEVADGQVVISTGPYSVVRHPMYGGALVLLLGIGPALGSWWGMLTIVPMTGVIVLRLLEEERFLKGNLAGYAEYLAKVRYRLAPFLW
jgi:protein-S-isoprenylcysteine O-methyltransferase Ste14